MFESDAPNMTAKDVRRWVVYPAIGGAVLGLVGYYTVGPGFAELQQNTNKPNQQVTNSTGGPADVLPSTPNVFSK